jgi:O-antigen/teichoic acid export membrane protein
MLLTRLTTSVSLAAMLFLVFSVTLDAAPEALLAAAMFIAAEQINELVQAGISGRHRQNVASALLVGARLIPLAAILIPSTDGPSIWLRYSAAQVVVIALSSGLAFGFARSQPAGFRLLFRSSLGYWLSTTSNSVGQLDVTVARFSVGVEGSGLWSAGNRIGTPLNLVTNAILNVFVPALASSPPHERASRFRNLRKFVALYGLTICATSPIIAGLLLMILGPAYQDGYWLYASICFAAGLSAVSQAYQAAVYAEGLPYISAVAIAIGTVTGLIAMSICGALAGPLGLAAGPIVAQSVILLLFHALWKRYIDRRGGGGAGNQQVSL